MRSDPTFLRFSRFFRTARSRAPEADDPLVIALGVLRARRHGGATVASQGERSEKSERRLRAPSASPVPDSAPDPFLRWRLLNAERLTATDLTRGYDAGGYCVEHGRILSYPEQKRGACSWCVPVNPDLEPEYWASHWRRFVARGAVLGRGADRE